MIFPSAWTLDTMVATVRHMRDVGTPPAQSEVFYQAPPNVRARLYLAGLVEVARFVVPVGRFAFLTDAGFSAAEFGIDADGCTVRDPKEA